MIMIVKTPGSQMGSPAAAEEGGEAMGRGRGESGEISEVHARPSVTSTAPKARSRSRGVATLDEAPRISLRMSSKLPTLAPSSLSSGITALARTSACPSTTWHSRTWASSLTSVQTRAKYPRQAVTNQLARDLSVTSLYAPLVRPCVSSSLYARVCRRIPRKLNSERQCFPETVLLPFFWGGQNLCLPK